MRPLLSPILATAGNVERATFYIFPVQANRTSATDLIIAQQQSTLQRNRQEHCPISALLRVLSHKNDQASLLDECWCVYNRAVFAL